MNERTRIVTNVRKLGDGFDLEQHVASFSEGFSIPKLLTAPIAPIEETDKGIDVSYGGWEFDEDLVAGFANSIYDLTVREVSEAPLPLALYDDVVYLDRSPGIRLNPNEDIFTKADNIVLDVNVVNSFLETIKENDLVGFDTTDKEEVAKRAYITYVLGSYISRVAYNKFKEQQYYPNAWVKLPKDSSVKVNFLADQLTVGDASDYVRLIQSLRPNDEFYRTPNLVDQPVYKAFYDEKIQPERFCVTGGIALMKSVDPNFNPGKLIKNLRNSIYKPSDVFVNQSTIFGQDVELSHEEQVYADQEHKEALSVPELIDIGATIPLPKRSFNIIREMIERSFDDVVFPEFGK